MALGPANAIKAGLPPVSDWAHPCKMQHVPTLLNSILQLWRGLMPADTHTEVQEASL